MIERRDLELASFVLGSAAAYATIENVLRQFIDDGRTRGQVRSLINSLLVTGVSIQQLLKRRAVKNSNVNNDDDDFTSWVPSTTTSKTVVKSPLLDEFEEIESTSRLESSSLLTSNEKLIAVLGGYLLDDLYRLLRTRDFDFIAHHVVGVLLCVCSVKYNAPQSLFPRWGILEGSTIFLNLAQLFALLPKGRTRRVLRQTSAILFVVNFFSLRVIYLPILLSSKPMLKLRQRLGKVYAVASFAWLLQLYWMYKIFKTMVQPHIVAVGED